jgi:hypothetical protein
LAVVARFVAPSALWLDEAQSVAIARLPLPGLVEALRQDGSPPLYYLLLHAWMGLVGTGSLAVRSLSGLFSVLTLLLAWRLTCQLAGRRAALALVMLLATSPFVIRYASEARMYSLLLLLTVVGAMAVRTVLRSPGPWPVLGLAAVTGALLLTHLWSFHLVAVVGVLALLELRNRRDAAVRVLTGLGLGVLTFLPWLPSFLVQLSHTGTPWTGQQGLWALPVALDAWQGGPGPMPRVLGTALILLVGLGVLAVPSGLRRPGHLLLGLRLRRSRAQLLVLSLGTLVVAAVVSLVTHSGLAGRYASIALPPFLALAALGVAALPTARARAITLTVVAGLGLTVALPTLMIPRTQAGEVARALRVAAPGDLVVFCPDQLGPSVSRLAPRGLRLVVYPDLRPAGRVDWTDYSDRVTAVPSTTVASTVLQRAGEHAIWVVTGRGYRLPSDARCRDFVRELTDVRGAPSQVVAYRSGVFEGQSLQRFAQHPLSALGRTSPPVDGAQSAGGGGTGVTTAYG